MNDQPSWYTLVVVVILIAVTALLMTIYFTTTWAKWGVAAKDTEGEAYIGLLVMIMGAMSTLTAVGSVVFTFK
jgi:hypothetical protein